MPKRFLTIASLLLFGFVTENCLAGSPMVWVEIAVVEWAIPRDQQHSLQQELERHFQENTVADAPLASTLAKWDPQVKSPLPIRANLIRVKIPLDVDIEMTSDERFFPLPESQKSLQQMAPRMAIEGIDVKLRAERTLEGKISLKSSFHRSEPGEKTYISKNLRGEEVELSGIDTLGTTNHQLLESNQPLMVGGLLAAIDHEGKSLKGEAVFIYRVVQVESNPKWWP